MNEKTVRLFHEADWIDINFAIRSAMTKTTLNKMTNTEDEIDKYVDTLTNTITSAIAEKVPTKSVKWNSSGLPGLPIEIRKLIRQKRHQRRLWQRTRMPQYKTNANRLQKRISNDLTIRKRDNWEMYCDDMELSEGQGAAWGIIHIIILPLSPETKVGPDQISNYDRETGDVRIPVGRGLYQRNREQSKAKLPLTQVSILAEPGSAK